MSAAIMSRAVRSLLTRLTSFGIDLGTLNGFDARDVACFAGGDSRFSMSLLRVLVSLGRVFHRLPRKLACGPVILLAVAHCSDTVGMRSKIVELGSSLVPIVSALPAIAASVASVAHRSLLL
jgi:hypothetical protein